MKDTVYEVSVVDIVRACIESICQDELTIADCVHSEIGVRYGNFGSVLVYESLGYNARDICCHLIRVLRGAIVEVSGVVGDCESSDSY